MGKIILSHYFIFVLLANVVILMLNLELDLFRVAQNKIKCTLIISDLVLDSMSCMKCLQLHPLIPH